MAHVLQFYIVSFLIFLAKALPVEVTTWITRRGGDLAFLILVKRRKTAIENVSRAFGDSIPEARKKHIARSAFQNAALAMTELLMVPKIKKDFEKRFKFFGIQYIEEAIAKKKGFVYIVSHLGSWEYLSFSTYRTGEPFSVVVKDIKNPHIDKVINEMRREMKIVPISKMNSMRTVFKQIKKGHGVAILIDQWGGDEGIWVNFFNEGTSTTSIPARLAEKTGCAIIPGYCLRKSAGQYEIHIEPPLEWDRNDPGWEIAITQKLNSGLEKWVRRYPEQWLWGHRRWKKKNTVRIPQ